MRYNPETDYDPKGQTDTITRTCTECGTRFGFDPEDGEPPEEFLCAKCEKKIENSVDTPT